MDIVFKELSRNSIQSWISCSSFIINVIKEKLYDYKKLYPQIFQRNILWTQNRINRHQNYQCHQFVQRLTWENAHLDGVVDDHCHAREITERCLGADDSTFTSVFLSPTSYLVGSVRPTCCCFIQVVGQKSVTDWMIVLGDDGAKCRLVSFTRTRGAKILFKLSYWLTQWIFYFRLILAKNYQRQVKKS